MFRFADAKKAQIQSSMDDDLPEINMNTGKTKYHLAATMPCLLSVIVDIWQV